MPPIQDHPLRYSLANELHARPFPALKTPCRAVFLAQHRLVLLVVILPHVDLARCAGRRPLLRWPCLAAG